MGKKFTEDQQLKRQPPQRQPIIKNDFWSVSEQAGTLLH